MITVTDDLGNKKILRGTIEGFSIKKTKKTKLKGVTISGLDGDWSGHNILCIFLGEEDGGGTSVKFTPDTQG